MKLVALVLALALPSCGLLRAPVKIAGGVVKGTANLTEAAITAPGKARKKRKDRKEREKADEEAEEKKQQAQEDQRGDLLPPMPSSEQEELPAFDESLPPLPSEYSVPANGYE